jgi:hypothetical protein
MHDELNYLQQIKGAEKGLLDADQAAEAARARAEANVSAHLNCKTV